MEQVTKEWIIMFDLPDMLWLMCTCILQDLMVHVEAVIPYGQGELVNLIHRLGIVELEVSDCYARPWYRKCVNAFLDTPYSVEVADLKEKNL